MRKEGEKKIRVCYNATNARFARVNQNLREKKKIIFIFFYFYPKGTNRILFLISKYDNNLNALKRKMWCKILMYLSQINVYSLDTLIKICRVTSRNQKTVTYLIKNQSIKMIFNYFKTNFIELKLLLNIVNYFIQKKT